MVVLKAVDESEQVGPESIVNAFLFLFEPTFFKGSVSTKHHTMFEGTLMNTEYSNIIVSFKMVRDVLGSERMPPVNFNF